MKCPSIMLKVHVGCMQSLVLAGDVIKNYADFYLLYCSRSSKFKIGHRQGHFPHINLPIAHRIFSLGLGMKYDCQIQKTWQFATWYGVINSMLIFVPSVSHPSPIYHHLTKRTLLHIFHFVLWKDSLNFNLK